MFDIHKAADAAFPLRFGNDMETDGGLARAFRTIDLDDASLGNAADAQSNVQAQAARGDRFHVELGRFAQLHDNAVAESLVEGGKRRVERFLAAVICHAVTPSGVVRGDIWTNT